MSAASSVLVLDEVSTGYGHADVLHEVSLDVHANEVVAVLGPNGAGKTTMMKAISGLLPLTHGRIELNGRALTGLPAHKVVAAGVAHVPQGRGLFGYSTGYENLRLGGFTRRDRGALEDDIHRFASEWPAAGRVLERHAQLMSGGEQQLIAIGRALMSRPRVLLLDEPSLGLAQILVEQLFSLIRGLVDHADGELAILIVEQDVRRACDLADQAHVLVNGRIVSTLSPANVTGDDMVAMYMGITQD